MFVVLDYWNPAATLFFHHYQIAVFTFGSTFQLVFPSTSNHSLSHFASTSDNATGACEDEAMGKSEMERTQPQGPRNCRRASILTWNSPNPVAAFILSDPCASPSTSWKIWRRLSKPSNQLVQAPLACHITSLRKFSCLGVMLCDII